MVPPLSRVFGHACYITGDGHSCHSTCKGPSTVMGGIAQLEKVEMWLPTSQNWEASLIVYHVILLPFDHWKDTLKITKSFSSLCNLLSHKDWLNSTCWMLRHIHSAWKRQNTRRPWVVPVETAGHLPGIESVVGQLEGLQGEPHAYRSLWVNHPLPCSLSSCSGQGSEEPKAFSWPNLYLHSDLHPPREPFSFNSYWSESESVQLCPTLWSRGWFLPLLVFYR